MQLDQELKSNVTQHAGFANFMWAVIFYVIAELAVGILYYGLLTELTSFSGGAKGLLNPVIWSFVAFFGAVLAAINLGYGLMLLGHRKTVDLHIAAEQLRFLERIATTLDTAPTKTPHSETNDPNNGSHER